MKSILVLSLLAAGLYPDLGCQKKQPTVIDDNWPKPVLSLMRGKVQLSESSDVLSTDEFTVKDPSGRMESVQVRTECKNQSDQKFEGVIKIDGLTRFEVSKLLPERVLSKWDPELFKCNLQFILKNNLGSSWQINKDINIRIVTTLPIITTLPFDSKDELTSPLRLRPERTELVRILGSGVNSQIKLACEDFVNLIPTNTSSISGSNYQGPNFTINIEIKDLFQMESIESTLNPQQFLIQRPHQKCRLLEIEENQILVSPPLEIQFPFKPVEASFESVEFNLPAGMGSPVKIGDLVLTNQNDYPQYVSLPLGIAAPSLRFHIIESSAGDAVLARPEMKENIYFAPPGSVYSDLTQIVFLVPQKSTTKVPVLADFNKKCKIVKVNWQSVIGIDYEFSTGAELKISQLAGIYDDREPISSFSFEDLVVKFPKKSFEANSLKAHFSYVSGADNKGEMPRSLASYYVCP